MTFESDSILMTEEGKAFFESSKSKDPKVIVDEFVQIITAKMGATKKLSTGLFPKQINQFGHLIGYKLAQKVKYSQLRRFVDAFKDLEIETDFPKRQNKLNLFPIYLIHGYSRKEELYLFTHLLNHIIQNEWIKEPDDFETLMDLVDAITAYFQCYESKED